jgi:hypothetical protein
LACGWRAGKWVQMIMKNFFAPVRVTPSWHFRLRGDRQVKLFEVSEFFKIVFIGNEMIKRQY